MRANAGLLWPTLEPRILSLRDLLNKTFIYFVKSYHCFIPFLTLHFFLRVTGMPKVTAVNVPSSE